MNTPFVPWIDLVAMQTQRVGELAWFLYSCAEREQRLNADAWLRWWTRGAASPGWPAPWPSLHDRLVSTDAGA